MGMPFSEQRTKPASECNRLRTNYDNQITNQYIYKNSLQTHNMCIPAQFWVLEVHRSREKDTDGAKRDFSSVLLDEGKLDRMGRQPSYINLFRS